VATKARMIVNITNSCFIFPPAGLARLSAA
jgi:hypothetical protein